MILLKHLEQQGVLTTKQKNAAQYYENIYIEWQQSLGLPSLSQSHYAPSKERVHYTITDKSICAAKATKYKWTQIENIALHKTSHEFLQKTALGNDTTAYNTLKRPTLKNLQHDLTIIYCLYKEKCLPIRPNRLQARCFARQ